MANEGGTPIPVPPRPPLWEAGVSYLNDAGLDSPYSVNTEPTQRTPPDYNYQLTPPNNLIYLTSPINPMDLPADARNPTGSNYIVQTTKHAYELMKLEAEARSHHGMRPPPPGAVIPLYTTSEGYPVYSDPRTQPHIRQQEHSWQQQQQRAGNPSETWPVQQSPTSIPQGWQQPNQGKLIFLSAWHLRNADTNFKKTPRFHTNSSRHSPHPREDHIDHNPDGTQPRPKRIQSVPHLLRHPRHFGALALDSSSNNLSNNQLRHNLRRRHLKLLFVHGKDLGLRATPIVLPLAVLLL